MQTSDTEQTDLKKEECLHDAETERAVISAMLNGLAYEPCTDQLTNDCFASEETYAIFWHIRAMKMEGRSVDWLAVHNRMQTTGKHVVERADIREIVGYGPVYDLDEKVNVLHMLTIRRRLLNLARRIEKASLDLTRDLATSITSFAQRLENISNTALNEVVSFEKSYVELEQMVEQASKDKELAYTKTGFQVYDENALLRPTALNVLGAYSGNGKSAFALTVAYNAAKAGTGVAYYSLEMSHTELTGRMAAHIVDVEPKSILYGINREPDTLERMRAAKKHIKGLPIYYDDKATMTFHAMEASIRQLARARKIKGVIVDYVQILMRNVPVRKDKTEEGILGDILRDLKNIAKQEGIWIMALSQLNRNHAEEEPRESDLRGSGQINESADSTVLLWRPGKYGKFYAGENKGVSTEATAQLYASKVRNGEEGKKRIIRFQADRAHFEEFADGEIPMMYGDDGTAAPSDAAAKRRMYFAKNAARKRNAQPQPPQQNTDSPEPPIDNQPTEGSIPF